MNPPPPGGSGSPPNHWYSHPPIPQHPHPTHPPHPQHPQSYPPPQYLPHPQQSPIQQPLPPLPSPQQPQIYTHYSQHAPPPQPYPQPPTTPQRWPQQPQTPIRQAPRPPPSPYAQSQPTAPEPSAVLLALAETYFEAAHKSGYATATANPKSAVLEAEAYCKLVATGLGCLEAALQYRLQPRVEALVRLRYAAILFDETDNLDEAEEALNKGIFLAQRNNLTELKYSMQHLLARIMFKNSQKVALKMVATMISEVEPLDLPLWNYEFRFLRFQLLMEHPTTRDDQAAIHVLQKTYAVAERRRDMGIMAMCSLLEAMLFLMSGVEGVEPAQRALGRAYTQQNSNHPMPQQIPILTHILDIVCSVMTGRSAEGEMKLRMLHQMLDQKERFQAWRDDGEFYLPINVRHGTQPQALKMRWLGKDDIWNLGYLISGVAKYQRNFEDYGKAERFLEVGLRNIDDKPGAPPKPQPVPTPSSLSSAQSKLTWRKTLKLHVLTYYIFIISLRTDWDTALHLYNTQLLPLSSILPIAGTPLGHLITYLSGVIFHGTGELYTALVHYSNLFNTLPADNELGIVAKLNSALILRSSDPAQSDLFLSALEPYCQYHKNENIKAAFIFAKSSRAGELVKTKNLLSLALRCAGAACNHQLTFIILAFMCQRFFAGVVSEQAEKSARAALQNAMKGKDDLWSYVAGEMYADCLSRKGSLLDAERQRGVNAEKSEKVVRNLTRHVAREVKTEVEAQGQAGYGQQQQMQGGMGGYQQPPPPSHEQVPQPMYGYQYPPQG